MMKKRVLSIFLSILTILLVIPGIHFSAEAATDYSAELRKKGFPESYVSSLNKLKQAHPNWNFEVLKVGETFSYSVSQERKSHSQQLIQNYSGNNGKGYYCTCSKCYKNGAPLVKEYPNWVSASQKAVEYYLDPRNFLDEKHIFQFESTLYNASQTQAGVESILKGTWMHDSIIVYKNAKGESVTYKRNSKSVKYSQAIMDASQYSGLSAYYLASKIVQEVGGAKPTAGGASGTYSGYKGIYNYYNIGANTGAADGLKWAATAPSNSSHVQTSSGVSVNLRSKPTTKSSIVASVPSGTSVKNYEYTAKQADGYKWVKLTNVSIGGKTYTGYIRSDYFVEKAGKDTYNRPWTNPYRTISSGAKWIADNFGKQYTGYLQKFNVNPASGYMHSHEYMANIQAASTEAVKTYNAYKNVGALNNAITFSIPIFNNMPGSSLAAPKLNPVKINTNGSFTLSWNSVSNADKYKIYIKQTDGSYKLMKTTSATSFTTAVAAIGRTYSYKIKAVNSKYNISSAFSNIESAKYDNKLSSPNMSPVVINSDCSFKLSWSAVSGADKYEIYLLGSNGKYNLMKTTTATSFTTAVATYGRKYSYKVRAVNSSKNIYSDFSNVVSATNTKLTVPTFNAVKVNSDCSFTLSWSSVYGADKYEIYLLGSNGKYNLMKTTTATSFTTAVATYGRMYSYKVKAVDSENNVYSEFSNIVSATNSMLPPSTFNPVKVNSDGSFNLSWTAVSGADKYEIYLLGSNGKYNLMKTTTATSFTTAVATYGREYAYKVRAIDSKNNVYSEFSNVITGVNKKKMSTPTLKSIIVNDNGTFTLSWNAVTGADKYEIYIYNNNTGIYQLNGTVAKTSATTAYAPYNVKYSYKIRALDSESKVYSDFSNVVSATNKVKLSAPTMKDVVVNSNGSFKLSWNSVAGADKYELYIEQADGSYKLMKTTTATSFTTAFATYGKQYSYKAKAINSKNKVYSDFSNVVSATNKVKLSSPTMKNVVVNSNGSFKLSWNSVAGADKYELYIKQADGSYKLMKTTTATSFTTAFATYGKQYSYKAKAINSKNKVYSDFSNVVSATNKVKLSSPIMKDVVVNSNGSFKLSWNSVAGADKYELYIEQADGSYKLMKTTTATSFTTAFATYGKQYSYKAKAVDSKNKVYSDFSNVVSATNNKRLSTPSNVKLTVNSAPSFTISWNAVSGANQYEVYLYQNGSFKKIRTVTANKTTLNNPIKGKQYTYKIRATDSKNNAVSDYSATVNGRY